MIFQKMISGLSEGQIKKYIDAKTLSLCKPFFDENLDDSKSKLSLLAQRSIKDNFFKDETLRSRLIDVSDINLVKDMCKRAHECQNYEEKSFSEALESSPFELLKGVISDSLGNHELINFILGFSNTIPTKDNNQIENISIISPEYGLYPYQIDIVEKLHKHFYDKNRCLVHMPTGSGKTRTSISYICDFIKKDKSSLVLWLADRQELCDQALEEFNKAWRSLGNREINSYGYHVDGEKFSLSGIDKGFLVCSTQSLWALKKRENNLLYRMLAEEVSLIVFDEAHKAAANTYSEMIEFIIKTNPEAKLIGLTATPGRKITGNDVADDENSKLSEIFRNNKISMEIKGYLSPIQYLYDKNYLATPQFIDIIYTDKKIVASTNRNLKISDAKTILAHDFSRNKAIFECIYEEVKNNNFIIVFANSVEHAHFLEGLCLVSDIKAASIDGNTNGRKDIIDNFKNKKIQVLINYDVLVAGFDAPHVNVAIISRPTNSLVAYSQMMGRAMRGGEAGNKNCKIYTVNDEIPEFKSVVKAFKHWDEYWN